MKSRLTLAIGLLFTWSLATADDNSAVTPRFEQGYVSCDELEQSDSRHGLTTNELQTGMLAFIGGNMSTYDFTLDSDELRRKLSDGLFGPTTKKAIKQICVHLTQLNVFSPGRSTVQLISNYAWLTKRLAKSSDLTDIVTRIRQLDSPNLAILAVNKELALDYLQGSDAFPSQINTRQQGGRACAGVYENYRTASDTQKKKVESGVNIILKFIGDSTPSTKPFSTMIQTACEQINHGQTNVLDTLSQVSNLDRHLKGGLATMATTHFSRWWSAQSDEIAKLLLGGPRAVQALVSIYNPPTTGTLGECKDDIDSGALTYYALDFAMPEVSSPTPALLLSNLAERTFSTPELLAEAIASELQFSNESCEYQYVVRLVQRSKTESLTYSVDLDTVPRLALDQQTKSLATTLEALPTVEAGTTQALRKAIIDALATDTEDTTAADITGIADLAAELAEEIPLRNDTSALALNPTQLPASVVYALTEQSIEQLLSTIDNPDFSKALAELPYSEKPDRDSINLTILNTLDKVRDNRAIANSVSTDKLVNAAATAQWKPTESLITEIVTHPQIVSQQSANLADIPDDVKDAIGGISYPNRRLMEKALLAPAIEPDKPLQELLGETQRNALVNASLKRVNTFGERDYSALAPSNAIAPSCGCALRRDNNGLVYAFHPFWKWPLSTDDDAPVPMLDFAYIDRIAFDGVVMEYKPAAENEAEKFVIRNARHWELAAQKFVKTAHRFEAKADLAIRIRGWQQWQEEESEGYAAEVSSLLNKYSSIQKSLPSSSYSDVPDGITLIFESSGATGSALAATQFLTSLREQLAEHQEITIGFDIDLNNAEPLRTLSEFSDSLLADPETKHTGKTSLLGRTLLSFTGSDRDSKKEDQPPAVDRILVFLERPTTDTKKTFRQLIEEMPDFRGSNRRDLFRKIVPIVSPSGNRALGRRGRDNKIRGVNSYGQFQDDLVYFRDNFGGIGFWPAPYMIDKEDAYVTGLNESIRREFNVPLYATVFNMRFAPLDTTLNQSLTPACRYICPHRNALYTIIFWLGVVIAIILIVGLFTGMKPVVRRAIPYGFAVIIGILTAILVCSKSALILAPVLIAITAVLWKSYSVAIQPDSPIP